MAVERHYVTGGIPARLDAIGDEARLTDADIAKLLDTSAQTIARWRQGVTPRPEQRDRLLDLHWIASQLAAVYEPDDTNLWLYSRHPRLNGERPADRIGRGDVGDVLALVNQLRTGAYT